MGQFSVWHWAIVAAVFLLFFGAKRMPDAARGLGRSLRIFKSEVSQMQSETDNSTHDTPAQQTTKVLPPTQSSASAGSERVFLSKSH
ncbi:Sec-independent protein translocase subunit TatA [Nocardia sp. XZ_19_231]|uniref:Sec-independent protein translocase subunit TatA n=1 Tax=Nocardia sp. XZ_19_231 TaxID=2769252 RepID=UPI00188E6E89|nr:Sec-independent protein translocase subunit TatA [Nocardia sp. XZ_19_231]